ncbi:mannosyl-oligosaccharide alpha-1,2-mannosidase [Linnemannia zychae]|nr:mannosyl-oligosaccharide alpha-1,2-mannosidase [Linnemannia zychae]
MFNRQDNAGEIPFHIQDQDDKYSKTPIGVQSKARFRFRLRHGIIALGVLALTYLVIRPSSDSGENSTMKNLKDRIQVGNRKPSDNNHDNIPVKTPESNSVIWEERREKVKEAFLHSWNAYRRDAWGKDEYHPVARYGSNMVKMGQGFTIVDSLDTMLLMGLKDEFEEAKKWVRDELTFDQEGEVNLFETTIRVLGGLLSAYDQSGNDRVFLTKAVDLADRLMGAFKTPSGIPFASVHLKEGRGVPGHEGGISSTSEVSTLQLEFKYLSYITGDDKYWRVAEDVILKMEKLESTDGLVPIYINPYNGQFHGSEIRLGSRGDSYYEYLIKQYLQTSKREPIYKKMFDYTMAGVKKHLLGRTIPNNLLFVGEISKYSPDSLSTKMDHLVCFLGGTMALSSTEGKALNKITFPRSKFSVVEEEDFKIGEELTEACYQMYNQTETGLAPEIVYWVSNQNQLSGRQEPEYFEGSDFIINNRDGHNWLRPETVESLFYMWRFTGDVKYREWGWRIFEAIEKYSKIPSGGYSSIHDIRRKDNINFSDKMETFFLAETLKYLYLLFGPNDVFPLDKYVFNTEAHPFPIFDPPKSLLERPVASVDSEPENKADAMIEDKEVHLPGHDEDSVDEALEELAVEAESVEAEEVPEVEVEYEESSDDISADTIEREIAVDPEAKVPVDMSAPSPPSPPHNLGPSSQNSQQTTEDSTYNSMDAVASSDIPTATTPSTTTHFAFDTAKYSITETNPFLVDPFNDRFDSHDDHSGLWDDDKLDDYNIEGEISTKPGNIGSLDTMDILQSDTAVDTVENLELLGYVSPASGESLRRLTLSPRKHKRTFDPNLGLSSPGSKPTLTFSERLLTEMGKAVPKEKHMLGNNNVRKSHDSSLKPKKIDFGSMAKESIVETVEDNSIVSGSDSESASDWDDKDIFVSAVSSPQKTPEKSPDRTLEKTPKKSLEETLPITMLSDEDIPTLSDFSKRAPANLIDSDSDMEDDLFSCLNSTPLNPTPPQPTAQISTFSTKAFDDDMFGSDIELSDYDDSTSSTGGSGRDKKRTRSETGSTSSSNFAPSSRYGRVLRNSNVKSTPASKSYKPVKKPFFSLDSLLKEKERKERVGFDLKAVKNQELLDDEMLEKFDENEYDNLVFTPQSVPQGVFSEEQEATLNEIIKDTYTLSVEDVTEYFVHWPQKLVVDPLEMYLSESDRVDHIIQKVLKNTQTETQRNQFLTSPFLTIICTSPWAMPRSLFRWLVHIVATEQNQSVTLSVYVILQRVLSQRTSLLGVNCQDLERALRSYGAREEFIDDDWKVTPVTSETRNERIIGPETPKFPRHNLKAILKLVNLTATLDPLFYDTREIRKIVVLLLRITTDPIIGDVKSLLGMTLAALLDAIPTHCWDTERNRICKEVTKSLGTSSAFLLLTLRQLPSISDRIKLLRRSIALDYLNQPPIPAGKVAPDINELHRALFVDKDFQIGTQVDYRLLGRRFQIYGFCLDDEEILASYGRKELEPLVRKLKVIHGRINDVKAAFMERTRLT